MNKDSIIGSLLGCLAGDSLGLVYEGLSPSRLRRLYPTLEQQRFIFNQGVLSDDTEHALMVALALSRSSGNEESFSKSLEKSLRRWVVSLAYGIGLATLKSCLRLLCGFPATRSGVFSAGNGPAMRSALLGVCYGDDREKMKNLVRISTRITHTDVKAEHGATAVAVAAYWASKMKEVTPKFFLDELKNTLEGNHCGEFLRIIETTLESVINDQSTTNYSRRTFGNKGINGYIYQTVPTVIHCWLRNQNDFKSGILEIIRCGGDTDTTAAILGSIIGANVHEKGIPEEWISNVILWPYNINYIKDVCSSAHKGIIEGPEFVDEPKVVFVLMRNICIFPIILIHAIRRIMPPY